ncbi:MAG: hypothetical protein WCG25_08500 [bacterium]
MVLITNSIGSISHSSKAPVRSCSVIFEKSNLSSVNFWIHLSISSLHQ